MPSEERKQNIQKLVRDLGCTENQARNALEISRDNLDMAKTIIKEYRAETQTTYAGGKSGQVVEMPKSDHTRQFEELMKHSAANQDKEPVGSKKLIVYKNGFLIDDKFTKLTEKEREEIMDKIASTGEVPSEMFKIKQGDLVDVEIEMKTDTVYKDVFDGVAHSISVTRPTNTGKKIALGTNETLFKLTLGMENVLVEIGGKHSFEDLKKYLEQNNQAGQLYSGDKQVDWSEDPSKYNRALLRIVK
ncbi:hypothetical protein NEOKW01_0206 [Nematocida sp. AWRm80]|nr:hypothetical protein NEOKW01_0206 [Nematocida sp. AWRm80]